MIIYLILLILTVIILISLIFYLIYLIKDEKELKKVDNEYLKSLGKNYSTQEFENTMYQLYLNILTGVDSDDYNYLKDAVSDNIYNKILYNKKIDKENDQTIVTTNINKEFIKLVSFKIINGQEVAKLWIKYSCIEYKSRLLDKKDEAGIPYTEEEIVSGDKNNLVNHNYIITFTRIKTDLEQLTCPFCGNQINICTSSKCSRCEGVITQKKNHWVYLGKEEAKF